MGMFLRVVCACTSAVFVSDFERRVRCYMHGGMTRDEAESRVSEDVNQCYVHA